MKPIVKILLFMLIAVLLSQCEKDEDFSGDSGTFKDSRDGHTYKWIRIGEQVWLAENLAYLPSVNNIVDGSEDNWKENDPFYYVYDYDGTDVSAAKTTSNYQLYGVLYNWNSAKTSSPDGWHLPTDDEWKELEMYLGMNQSQADSTGLRGTAEGSKLKATSGWEYNGNGTNESGFTALPGGNRLVEHYSGDTYYDYMFANSGVLSNWWSATEFIESGNMFAWSRCLQFSDDEVIRHRWAKVLAISIRCVKDE